MISSRFLIPALLFCLAPLSAVAQQPLDQLPGYDAYREASALQRVVPRGSLVSDLLWSRDGKALYFQRDGEHFQFDLTNSQVASVDADARPEDGIGEQSNNRGGRFVPRAQQSTSEPSPDGKWIAQYSEYNVVLVNEETKEEVAVTDDGSRLFRYGTACWVYGEELDQNAAMWWSPDSKLLAYYEIDERHMKEYFLTVDNTDLYTTIHSERYPKPGEANPYVGLIVYDLESGTKVRVESGDAETWYLYNIRFAPDGNSILFNRTNRHQSHLQVMAADPKTGASSLVVEERQETWQDNAPTMQFLEDGQRFVWATERNGFRHYELRDLDGRLLNPLSEVADYPTTGIVKLDENAGYFYYSACSGEMPLNEHLHRVRLDGSDHRRLTARPANHSAFVISPDHQHFLCRYETMSQAPAMAIYNVEGEELAVLAEFDTSAITEAGISAPELFSFKADDGETDLYGVLYKPADFDPNKKYPLVISVYGGPFSRAIYNRYSTGYPHCEFGFLVARIDNRGTVGRGKAFESANYLDLGGVDLKDQIDGVRHLAKREYVDSSRVGIFGHSYGGYMSALAILKYPDDIQVAVAGAPVTDWKNYDTIYTERYMRTPAENSEGYQQGSCLSFTNQLQGKLLILHGLVDDNVHPANTWQLIDKLQSDNKRFDLMVYPRSKHGLISSSNSLRWEYLHQHLRPTVED